MKTRYPRYHLTVVNRTTKEVEHSDFEYSGYAMAEEMLYLKSCYPSSKYIVEYDFEIEKKCTQTMYFREKSIILDI